MDGLKDKSKLAQSEMLKALMDAMSKHMTGKPEEKPVAASISIEKATPLGEGKDLGGALDESPMEMAEPVAEHGSDANEMEEFTLDPNDPKDAEIIAKIKEMKAAKQAPMV